eukprot:s1620_g6.t1
MPTRRHRRPCRCCHHHHHVPAQLAIANTRLIVVIIITIRIVAIIMIIMINITIIRIIIIIIIIIVVMIIAMISVATDITVPRCDPPLLTDIIIFFVVFFSIIIVIIAVVINVNVISVLILFLVISISIFLFVFAITIASLKQAYKKNYKLDKAEAVLLRCTRNAELRSGAWQVKYLNHMSQVRMKQSRDVEAMEMMYEMESLATFPMHEPGAAQFYETLYRNMSSSLRRMGREDEAALYFLKMAEACRFHKKQLDWMDLWDLGILIANRAYQAGRWPEFYKSREIIAEARAILRFCSRDELAKLRPTKLTVIAMAEGGDAPQHIQLKVKDQQGSEVQFKIKKTTPLRKLMDAYCSRLGLQASQVRFMVDGERIAADDTAEKLGLEDEDLIDVAMEQTGGALR